MDWFLYDNGLRHERVNLIYYISVNDTVVKYVIACLGKMPFHLLFSYFSKM